MWRVLASEDNSFQSTHKCTNNTTGSLDYPLNRHSATAPSTIPMA